MFRRDLLPPSSGYSEIIGFFMSSESLFQLSASNFDNPKIIILLLEAVRFTDFTVNFSLAGRSCYIYFQPYYYVFFPLFLLPNLEFQHLHHKNTSLCGILSHISPLHNPFLQNTWVRSEEYFDRSTLDRKSLVVSQLQQF